MSRTQLFSLRLAGDAGSDVVVELTASSVELILDNATRDENPLRVVFTGLVAQRHTTSGYAGGGGVGEHGGGLFWLPDSAWLRDLVKKKSESLDAEDIFAARHFVFAEVDFGMLEVVATGMRIVQLGKTLYTWPDVSST